MIAPTFRSRFGQPSSRLPTPGRKKLSTVEWHNAQVVPTLLSFRTLFSISTLPLSPITASSSSSTSVVAGLFEIDATVRGCRPSPTAVTHQHRLSDRLTRRWSDRRRRQSLRAGATYPSTSLHHQMFRSGRCVCLEHQTVTAAGLRARSTMATSLLSDPPHPARAAATTPSITTNRQTWVLVQSARSFGASIDARDK